MLVPRKVTTSDSINIVGIVLAFVASILSIAFAIATLRLAVTTWRLHRQSQQQQGSLPFCQPNNY
jgi:uncharacterized Tic20 family protein